MSDQTQHGSHPVGTDAEGRPGGDAHGAQPGPEQVREENIVLNDQAFADAEGRRRYAGLVAGIATHARGRSEQEVDALVRESLAREGVELPPVQVDRLVEQIVRGEGVAAISGDDGTVLEGAADPAALQNPAVGGQADPENRPTYA